MQYCTQVCSERITSIIPGFDFLGYSSMWPSLTGVWGHSMLSPQAGRMMSNIYLWCAEYFQAGNLSILAASLILRLSPPVDKVSMKLLDIPLVQVLEENALQDEEQPTGVWDREAMMWLLADKPPASSPEWLNSHLLDVSVSLSLRFFQWQPCYA